MHLDRIPGTGMHITGVDVAENVLPSVGRGVGSFLQGFICDKTHAHSAHLQSTVRPPRSRYISLSVYGAYLLIAIRCFRTSCLFGVKLAPHFSFVEQTLGKLHQDRFKKYLKIWTRPSCCVKSLALPCTALQ